MEKKESILVRDESGEIMLEATIIVTMVVFFMLALISVGFLFYQRAMLTSVAMEIASDIGASYKYAEMDLSNITISEESMEGLKMYRTSLGILSMQSKQRDRGAAYLAERIPLTSLGASDGEPTLEKVTIKADGIGRLHVEVQLSMKSELLFGGLMEFFEIAGANATFTAVGRAECFDITGYAGHVHYLEYLCEKAGDSNIFKILDSFGTILDSLTN